MVAAEDVHLGTLLAGACGRAGQAQVLSVRIDGPAETEMSAAVALLVDTVRAWRVRKWLPDQRAARTVAVLEELGADWARVRRDVPASAERWAAMQAVEQWVDRVVLTALGDGLLGWDELAELAGIDAGRMADLRSEAGPPYRSAPKDSPGGSASSSKAAAAESAPRTQPQRGETER